jgi:hypothetical protein
MASRVNVIGVQSEHPDMRLTPETDESSEIMDGLPSSPWANFGLEMSSRNSMNGPNGMRYSYIDYLIIGLRYPFPILFDLRYGTRHGVNIKCLQNNP